MEILNQFFRANTFPIPKQLVHVTVKENHKDFRAAATATDSAMHFRAVRVLLDVVYSPCACQQIQREVGFCAVLGPWTSAADTAIASEEVHRQFPPGRAAVGNRT